jgi:antibiotic biosynthesis monooxygenase (ABM) superfamily enzyme
MSNSTAQHTPPAAPPRYKLALVTWAGAFGVITLILDLLGPTMASWPLVLRTLLISVLMVNALTWIVLPALTRLFRAWLLGAEDRSAPRPVPSTCAPASRSWAPAGRAG